MSHQKQSRSRHARVAHAYDTPDERDLFERAMLPRFSPTATYANGGGGSPATTSSLCGLLACPGSSSAGSAPASSSAALPPPTPAPVSTSSSTPAPVAAPTTTSSSSTSAAPSSTSASTSSSSSSSSLLLSSSSSSTLLSTSTAVVPLPTSTSALSSSTVPAITAPVTTPTLGSLTTTIGAATSATPSATSTSAPSGGTSTSVVVGGIAGGLVGVAGLIFLVMFIMRRYRKNDDDEDSPFDADNFRRQSAILIDDNQAGMGGGGRGGARPPTMIERHMQNTNTFDAPPMPSLQQYHQYNDMPGAGMAGAGGNAYEGNGYGGEYDGGYPSHNPGGLTRQPSFSPGQIVSPTSPPPVHGGYGDMSRQPSLDHYGQPMQTGYGDLARQPSNAGYPDMNRQNSIQQGLGVPQHYGDGDMDRSSVTPYQAQQYAEIHQKLNLDPAAPLNAVNEDDEASSGHHPNAFHQQHYDEPEPFDPRGAGPSIDEGLPNPFGDSEIVPPSPVYSMNPKAASAVNVTRDRVVSGPPTIPELARAFSPIGPSSYDFPQTPSVGGRPSPSPLNSGFVIPPAGGPVPRLSEKTNAQRPMSTHTVYDEADAYGGF